MSTVVKLEPARITYPSKERIHTPLAELLALAKTTSLSVRQAGLLQQAQAALALLDGMIPAAIEVLDEFTDPCSGPLASLMRRAAADGWRNGKHDDELTKELIAALYERVEKLFLDLAASSTEAKKGLQALKRKATLIKETFDTAQRDGWELGDYRSDKVDELESELAKVIRASIRLGR